MFERDRKLPTESHLPTFESVNNSNGAATPAPASSALFGEATQWPWAQGQKAHLVLDLLH